MKKILLSVLLVLCLLLSMAACDTGNEQETEAPKIDVPQDNVNSLVGDINEFGSLEKVVSDSNAQMPEIKIEAGEVVDFLDKLEYEAEFSATAYGETVGGYAAIKDKVGYADLGELGKYYVFVEDDLKLVFVSESDGEADGYVEDSLVGLLDTVNSLDDILNSEDSMGQMNEMVTQLVDAVLAYELPEIKAEDVKYEDGKYVISVDYIKNTVESFIDTVITPELTGVSSEDIANAKSLIRGYMDKMGIKLYFYMEYEEITGFGFSVDFDKAFAEETLGMEEIKACIDIHDGKFDASARLVREGTVVFDMAVKVLTINNSNGELTGFTLDADIDVMTYDYDYDYESWEPIEKEKPIGIKLDILFDMDKVKNDGTILDVNFEVVESNNQLRNNMKFTANVTSSENCTKFKGDVNFVNTEDGEKAMEFVAGIELLTNANNMPAIPQVVVDAREEALEEYDNYSEEWDDWY